MWNPEKLSIATEKRMILSIAELEISKRLDRIENKIIKTSKDLREMDIYKTTPARRRAKRLTLDALCEERDSLKKRIDIINNWEI